MCDKLCIRKKWVKMDRLDRTFEDFFTSLGMGVAACTCTIIVCVGKLLTQHFFYFIILILLVTLLVTWLLTYQGKYISVLWTLLALYKPLISIT